MGKYRQIECDNLPLCPRAAPPSATGGPLRAAVLLVSIAVAICGCRDSGKRSEPTLARLRAAGVVRVGFANEAPYAYLDPESGKLTGEAPEIARRIFAALGIPRVEGVLTEFGSLIPGLKARRFDVIAAGMYITPPRCKQVAFSQPTYAIGEAFVVAAGNPSELHSYADVRDRSDVQLGVVAGTVERGYARSTGIPDDRVITFPDPPSAVAGVEAGRIDAYAGTSLTVSDMLTKAASDKIERARPFADPLIDGHRVRGYGAFAFRKSDPELLTAFNERLAVFLGTPAHSDLVAPFGFGPDDRPEAAVTTESLCKG